MKTLTLSLNRAAFDQVLAGTRKHECRDIFPENQRRFIRYVLNGKSYVSLEEMPSEEEEAGEVDVVPVKYDCIKFLTGSSSAGPRPFLTVEVLDAEVIFLTNEEGEDLVIVDDETGIAFLAMQVEYTLGKIIGRNDI